MSGVPSPHKRHRTTVEEVSGNFVWRCSCGDFDNHVGMSYRIATAGAKRHRDNVREMRRVLGSLSR